MRSSPVPLPPIGYREECVYWWAALHAAHQYTPKTLVAGRTDTKNT